MRSLGRQELSKDEAAGTRSLRARGGRGAERALPEPFARWFADRGWPPRPHQLALLDAAEQRRSTLLIAPTGAGKTLAGFLPSLVNLAQRRRDKRENKGARPTHALHLAAQGAGRRRRAQRHGADCGDEPADPHRDAHRRHPRQPPPAPTCPAARHPDDDAGAACAALEPPRLRASVRRPRHRHPRRVACARARPSAAISWRSTSRGCARSRRSSSASVCRQPWRAPRELRAYLVPQRGGNRYIELADWSCASRAAPSRQSRSSTCDEPVPWAGHTTLYAVQRDLRRDRAQPPERSCSSTRACRPSCCSRSCGASTRPSLPIALHHGSLDAARRRKVEAAMAAGTLRAVVATSTLDLGIDWGDVDLVINVGAPKGASRLIQRDRPRQSPARGALARDPGARRTASRCSSAAPRSMRPRPASRMPCCRARARSTCWPSTCSAPPARAPFEPATLYPRGPHRRALRPAHARQLRPRRRLRVDRRLRAQDLRPLCAPEARARRYASHRASALR